MNRLRSALGLALAVVVVPLLSGCGRAQGSDSPQALAAPGEQASVRKYDAYIDGYNELIDIIFGLKQAYSKYRELRIAQADPHRDLYFNPADTTVRHAIAALRAGRTIAAGDTGAADRATDALLPTLERIQRRYETLGPYYASKAYRHDRLARGRAEDAALIADYETALRDIDQLGRVLDAYQRANRARAFASTQRTSER